MKIKYIIFGIIIFSALGFLKPSSSLIYAPETGNNNIDRRSAIQGYFNKPNNSSSSGINSGSLWDSKAFNDAANTLADWFLADQKKKRAEAQARAERLRKEQYPEYSSILYSSNNFKIVGFDRKEGVVSNNDRKIIPIKYQSITHKKFSDKEFFQAELYGKTAVFNIYGELVTPLKKYESIKYIHKLLDFIIVEFDGKRAIYSLYNYKKEIVPPYFEEINFIPSSNGIGNYFLTKNKDKKGLYNESGQLLFDNKFDKIDYVSLGNNSQYSTKKNDFFVVKYGNYKGLYDNDGKNIIPSIYSDIRKINENSNNKIAVMVVEKNNKKGLYNLDTRERLLPPIYDEIKNINFYDFDGFNYRKVKINVLINGKQKEKKIRLNSQGKMN